SLLVTMGFATTYAITHFMGKTLLAIPTMVQVHGLLNVLGFCVAGLLGLYRSRPAPT
ncbi:MAG: YndJ family transporter, partial [Polyangiaceae bacterium]|nr:YndJ family transporter [Polyangiaceae bacterium]